MAKLAIIGHSTRGNEVIETLEMLGGINRGNRLGVFDDSLYLINAFGDIEDVRLCDSFKYQTYTLEEFLEKFPYKVGDKVLIPEYKSEVRINDMKWNRVEILYSVFTDEEEWYSANELIKFNDTFITMEEIMPRKYNVEDYLKVWEETEKGLEVVVNDNFELREDNGKFYIIKNKSQYPKTYGECHEIMLQLKEYDCNPNSELIFCESPIYDFCKIIVARNIYWKIAGEQMGLGKPWKPDFTNDDEERYGIYTTANKVVKDFCGVGDVNMILTFPTEEMRNAFFENFKDLIEQCKELL